MCEREALLRGVFHRSLARLTRRAEALDERLAAAGKDAHVVRRVPRREGGPRKRGVNELLGGKRGGQVLVKHRRDKKGRPRYF